MRFKSQYVGTVWARSKAVTANGDLVPGRERHGRWILTVHWLFGRRAKLIGNPGWSPSAIEARARVAAWLAGGPLPPLDNDTRQRKLAPVIKIVKK